MRFPALVLLAACGGSSSVTPDAPPDPELPDAPAGCPRAAGPDDRARFVVVSHPYDAAGNGAGEFEVLALSAAGELTRPGRTFTMGRAVVGTIAFTPDGEVGIAALDNGKLGVFTLDAAGTPTVVAAEFEGGFYADRVVIDGDRAYVLDGNTRENGGGVYLVTIGCDGALTDGGLVVPAKTPGGLALLGDRALIAGTEVLDAPTAAGGDVHLLDWGARPAVAAGADAFGDDLAIIGGTALSHDGTSYLVGDVSQFSGVPTRIAVVDISNDDTPRVLPRTVIELEDPQAIAASPFGNVAVVASAFGDALFVLDDQGTDGSWRVRGEVAYAGAAPQLPGDVTAITRGTLRGHVLVSELSSVRHLVFGTDGSVTDLGSLAFGDGLEHIGGAIGVTP